jgi:hypothetical protein
MGFRMQLMAAEPRDYLYYDLFYDEHRLSVARLLITDTLSVFPNLSTMVIMYPYHSNGYCGSCDWGSETTIIAFREKGVEVVLQE